MVTRRPLPTDPTLDLARIDARVNPPDVRHSRIEFTRGVAQLGLERLVRDQEVASSNLVTPTIPQIEPFGQNVEGLSLFQA